MSKTCSFFFLGILLLLQPSLLFSALEEKDFQQDIFNYQTESKNKKLGAEERLQVLNRLREKYKETEFDLTDLYGEINQWTQIKQKQSETAPPKKERETKQQASVIQEVLVSNSSSSTRFVLKIIGPIQYKDRLIHEETELQKGKIEIEFLNTKEKLKPAAKKFKVLRGTIEEVEIKQTAGEPAITKVGLRLREKPAYHIRTSSPERFILTFDRKEAVSVSTENAVQTRIPAPPAEVSSPAVLVPPPIPAETEAETKEENLESVPPKPEPVLESSEKIQAPPSPPKETKKQSKILNRETASWLIFLISIGTALTFLI